MSELAAIFDADSLDALGPAARARLDVAWAGASAQDGDCVLAHTEVVSDEVSARVTVWHLEDGVFHGRAVTAAADNSLYIESTTETRDDQGRPLTRTVEVEDRVMRSEVWRYAGGTTRHVSKEPLVDTRSVTVERTTSARIAIDHDYHEGPLHKVTSLEVALDAAGRPTGIEALDVENHQKQRCGSTYVWSGAEATIDFTCDGEAQGKGLESRDAQGRPIARSMVIGTGDNAWSSSYTWTWGPQGLVASHRAVPFLGAVAQAWIRDDKGHIAATIESGDTHRVIDLRSATCPVEEPVVPRWIGDEAG